MNFKEFDNPREKQQVRPVTTMDPKEFDDRIKKAKAKAYKKPEGPDISKLWAKEKPAVEAGYSGVTPGGTKVDYANMMFRGKEIDHNSIEYEMQDFSDMMFELHGAKYIDGTPLTDKELEEFEQTGELIDWISMDYVSESEVDEDGMTSADVDRVRNQNFTTNQIKHAYRVLNHPSVKGGNMTAAYNIINRIAPGLADHPDVANALMKANEMQETRGSTLAVRTISNYADELGPDSMDYDMLKKSAEMLERGELEELGKFLHDSDTSPREYVMKVISKKDPDTFKQMYGDQEGYMSLMKPMGMEGFIGKKPEYNDFLQNKLDQAIQEYDSPEKKAERDALMQKYLNKGGKIEKVPTGKTAYKGKELKPAYKKDTAGTPITSPMSDESVQEDINEKGRIVLEKAGFDPNAIHEYMAVFNDHGDTTDLEDMNRNKIGVADAMAMVLASHDVQNESVEESSIKPYVSMYKGDDGKTVYDVLDKDGKSAYKTKDERLAQHYFKKNYQKLKEDGPPFGSGMELLRMAIMRKFITVQEWDLLKHKWNDAADEVEQKYADWPEGEGFGSSDHNFAIRDLMTAVGYEFDDQDTSGRFVVTKQPEEIEKAGITNARMSKDARIDRAIEKQKADAETNPNWGKDIGPVATEGGMPASIIKHKQKLAHMSDEELADRFKDFDEQRLRQMAWRHGYGKMSSHYLDRVRNHMTSKRTGTTEAKQEGFAVRYLDPKNGKRFAVAFKTKVDATKKAAQLKSVGVKDISITQHNLNFKEAKKDLTYESKLANMLNQRLK